MDRQLYFAEIVPNIYWVYHDTNIIYNPEHKEFIAKICELHHIKEIIKIDTNSKFWNRHSNERPDELTILKKLLNNIYSQLDKNYKNRTPTLIISIMYNDIGLAGILYFFRETTNLSMPIIMDALKYKIINIPEIGGKLANFLELN